MSDFYIESFVSKCVEKWRIFPVRTRDGVAEIFIIARQCGNADATNADNVKMFLCGIHGGSIGKKKEK